MNDFYFSKIRTKENVIKIAVERWGYSLPSIKAIAIDLPDLIIAKISEKEIIAEYHGVKLLFFQLDETARTEHQSIDQFIRSTQREIIKIFPDYQRNTSLFIFSTCNGEVWHFVYAKSDNSALRLKRFVVSAENRSKLRTASDQLDKLKIKAGDTTQKVLAKLDEAFSIEAVSGKFYNDFRKVFDALKASLYSQNPKAGIKNAHRFTQQLLNRLMFLYFVQKKDCFGSDKHFMAKFWNAYRDTHEGSNEFYDNWLKLLFLEALNNKFFPRKWLKPGEDYPDFNEILITAPFLNGGLFRHNEFDDLAYKIPDEKFQIVFDFLESYNFTIHESTPLDLDLSIDPEMLGNIYEMLVNVSEAEDEQHQAGIFYTPKVEIELMLRRSLVEFLHGKMEIAKENLYRFMFPDQEDYKEVKFSEKEIDFLLAELEKITIVDPACGSGHYLVVAAQIIWELKSRLYERLGKQKNKFEEKQKIIENSIYGVDIKEWATEIAKLRLWLDLFVDADEEHLRNPAPLLPSLSFKIRVGDSLVQEIGGFYFKVSQKQDMPGARTMLSRLKELKDRFFENDPFVKESKIKSEELQFYRTIIDEKIKDYEQKIATLKQPLRYSQDQLLKVEATTEQLELPLKDKKEIARLEKEISNLKEQRDKLSMKSNFAFWPIEFADIFADKGGFDIVIANPPYVRQEKIGDPTIEGEQPVEQRRLYKNKLIKQLQYDWNEKLAIDRKSDLYVYFYLKSLKLLNPNGVMCFVSSNSWLDVGYGAKLQEILLKKVPIVSIYDNQAKRSFKNADVNTVIVILRAPVKKEWSNGLSDNRIDFVMFKKPYEVVSYSDTFIDIEKQEKRTENEYFKLHPIKQHDLYQDGLEMVEDDKTAVMGDKEHFGVYGGNKWGGKYLRAPEIYWKILEKAGDKLVRLGDIAEVRFGIKTGCNEFFYLPSKHFDIQHNPKAGLYHLIPKYDGLPTGLAIEEEFLKPVIKSSRECHYFSIEECNLKQKLVMLPDTGIKTFKAYKYLDWGENMGFNENPTCSSRSSWWFLGIRRFPDIISPCSVNDLYRAFDNNEIYADKRLYEIYAVDSIRDKLLITLCSIITTIFLELGSRVGLGEGLLDLTVYELSNCLIVNPALIKTTKLNKKRKIESLFVEIGLPIPSEDYSNINTDEIYLDKVLPDRRALDKIVFEALGLTEEEQLEVYKAVVELVKNRLTKAHSV